MVESPFLQVALILVLAVGLGFVAKLLRQPVLVAYILAGIIVGPSVLGLVSSGEEVSLLAEVGIAMVLFLVGLKLDVHLISTTGRVALITGVGQVVLTAIVGYLLALAFGFSSQSALYISTALTFSSTIIIVKLLSDKRELDLLHGRIAIGVLIVQDLLVIIAMVVVVAIGQPDTSGGSVAQTLVTTLLMGTGFLIVVVLLARYVVPPMLDWLARSQELTLLFSVAWAVALSALSEELGLSMEIGAFVAGVALASTPYRESIGARLVTLRDILLLFFFIELGAAMAFTDATSQIVPALVLSAFVLIAKPLSVIAIMGLLGYRKRVSFKTGVALAQISEFSLILIALGYSLGQVDEEVLGLVTLVGIITISLSTYMILYSEQIYQRLAPALSIFERRLPRGDLEQVTEEHPFDAIVVGAGRLGALVIDGLKDSGRMLLVVDVDPRALRDIAGPGIETQYGDVREPEFVAALPLHESDQVICAIPELTTNLLLRDNLRQLDYDGRICLTAMDTDSANLLAHGDDVTVIKPFKVAAKSIVEQTKRAARSPEQQEDR